MAQIGAAAVCAVIAGIVAVGYIKGLPVFDLFIEGAAQGLKTAVKLLPTLVGLIAAASFFVTSRINQMEEQSSFVQLAEEYPDHISVLEV